ncbi:MAG: lipid A biosynthesis acyltransferase [Prevotella sp.]|nr:lipid A biosynthesis acyltransferase [Prevotella sp.]
MGLGRKRKEGTTYGNAKMFSMLISLLKHVNIKIIYGFMSVCVIPVTLVLSPGARIAYRYFHEKRGYSRWKSLKATYRNHCIFGQTVIDKFAMYAGRKLRITYHGDDLLMEMTSKPEPMLMLNAHIGCSEIVGYSIHLTKPCNILVYGGEKQSLMSYRQASFRDMNMKMIPVGIETSHSEEIVEALDNGEAVSAFVDRVMNKNKVVTSSIHGHQVNLAKGPLSLATTRGLNALMVSAMKEKDGSYTAYMTPLYYDKTLPKGEQRQQLADAYTAEIERLLEAYPLQWFNYSDIWVD